MNYFELHVGDYDAATAHLSMLEDAAYGRMLRIYYRTEKPLPADVRQVCRLARAQSKAERDAVQAVLDEFFVLAEDGWRQQRADAELARYQDGEPEREQRKTNEETRLKRHREERAALFKAINDAGMHAPWNTKIEELRRIAAPFLPPPATAPETKTEMPPATAPATPATATHGNVPPLPTTPYPVPKEEIPTPTGSPARKRASARAMAADDLVVQGVDRQHADDWLAVRKAKGTPLTHTAWDQTVAEAQKAGVSSAEAVRIAAANGWAGFRASWLQRQDAPPQTGQPSAVVRPLNRQLAVEAENRRVANEWLAQEAARDAAQQPPQEAIHGAA